MISYDHIMVRFGELSTKGKNKSYFIKQLGLNIRHALKDKNADVEVRYDHIYVLPKDNNFSEIISILQDISGIHSLSLVHKCEKDIEVIKNNSLELIKKEEDIKTFKVKSKRSDKTFPIVSEQIIRQVAPVILKNTDLKVDVHNPDVTINIEIREEAAYIYTKTILGAGGYPLGVGGKAMLMLSGGIDSPVAAYLLMKRGVKIECIHFASPPYTDSGVIYKLEDILTKLNKYQATIRLHIVPFTKLQEAIYDNVPESYCITIMRRMMYRLAASLAYQRHCPVFASGESVGQVASQTLESMRVINEVTSTPVIRPCATMDKLDIIALSKKIDTYDISIRPFEDCCTIFTPKNPKTMPDLKKAKEYENKFDYQSLIKEALENIEVKYIGE